mmetsp:Transcript_22362/g.64250  ORF Transcript_22362/g.64250 Transcript_22362/m.64250 type:complete len:205 (-) Transcript_22362:1025-1639(-)
MTARTRQARGVPRRRRRRRRLAAKALSPLGIPRVGRRRRLGQRRWRRHSSAARCRLGRCSAESPSAGRKQDRAIALGCGPQRRPRVGHQRWHSQRGPELVENLEVVRKSRHLLPWAASSRHPAKLVRTQSLVQHAGPRRRRRRRRCTRTRSPRSRAGTAIEENDLEVSHRPTTPPASPRARPSLVKVHGLRGSHGRRWRAPRAV